MQSYNTDATVNSLSVSYFCALIKDFILTCTQLGYAWPHLCSYRISPEDTRIINSEEVLYISVHIETAFKQFRLKFFILSSCEVFSIYGLGIEASASHPVHRIPYVFPFVPLSLYLYLYIYIYYQLFRLYRIVFGTYSQ